MTPSAGSSWPKAHLVPTSGTYPRGFRVAGLASGVKKHGKKDLAVVVSDHPCTAAAVFTQNAFSAAPVNVTRQQLTQRANADFHQLVVNSGCANACTGERGLADAHRMVDLVSGATGREGTLVMSTGVIGQHLQMDKIGQGIAQAVAQAETSHDAWLRVSEAIMTTDTFPKLMSREVTLPGTDRSYRLVGFCKGAGMIKPNMATMLASIFTDANVSAECIQLATKSVVEHSFNAIIVDGDTSTNDTFAVMANGASGMDSITDPHSAEFAEFQAQLRDFATTLSQLIVRDGEGATKFVDVHVKNAPSFADAKAIANTIALSPLVKTAMYGRDANWGRIICAVGYSGVRVTPEKVNMHLCAAKTGETLHLFKDGAPHDTNETVASRILDEEDLIIQVDLGLGQEEAHVYTCDFSTDYIHINADYRS